MKTLEKYNINLYSLEEKSYEYDYKIDDSFFIEFDESPITIGSYDIHILLQKRMSTITVDFDIKGTAILTCDKSLRPFEENFNDKKRLIFKIGDRFEELSDEMYLIPANMDELELATYIYELIIVLIPFRNIHPDLREADENEEEGLVYMTDENLEEEPEQEDEDLDPRWKALKNLKTNN